MVVSDYYSRELDTSDYGISNLAFNGINETWGPFDVDGFASETNRKVECFFSKLYSQSAAGMDGLAQRWEGLHLWLCPPLPLVSKVIWKLVVSQGASGVLVVPKWPLSNFWMTLLPDGSHFASCVRNWIAFRPKYYSGDAVTSRIFRGVKKWETLAVYLAAGASDPLEPNYAREFCIKCGCALCE